MVQQPLVRIGTLGKTHILFDLNGIIHVCLTGWSDKMTLLLGPVLESLN